jgi:flagellar P-ring protein precursor FlgI
VERETRTEFDRGGVVRFLLNNPDFTTADRVANAVNHRYGAVATVVDPGCVEMRLPAEFMSNASRFVASVELLGVTPDAVARVVINERTGTVVMGGDVRISQVAVAHGDLTVSIGVDKGVSQPEPFSKTGTTEVVETAQIGVQEEEGKVALVQATSTVNDVVESLNSLGASPRDIISIIQAIDRAGALQGELVIM